MKLRNFIKNNLKLVVAFTLGLLVAGTGVYAAGVITSKEVTYSNSSSGLSSTNVKGAIDELNTKATEKIAEAKKECPDGYNCIHPLCKRAKILHTEVCSIYRSSCAEHQQGETITYGNLGTRGVLTTGDAFDCDVNGDGIYDSTTERFYYVSDMTDGLSTYNDIAVLVYYNNVSSGNPSISAAYAYDESGNNNNGPVTAIKQLPTTSQWKNVALTNKKRTITSSAGTRLTSGGNLPSVFDYSGYAARLLTVQEARLGCTDSQVNSELSEKTKSNCEFLFENTSFAMFGPSNAVSAIWLESPISNSNITSWVLGVALQDPMIGVTSTNMGNGVRPTIEVLKSNILY